MKALLFSCKVTYELSTGRVFTDEDWWKFIVSDLLKLMAGDNILRMEYMLNTDEEDTRQFSNVLMIGFVAVDPAGELLDQADYIEALHKALGL